VMLALAICVSFWSFQRALEPEDEEPRSRRWAALLAVSLPFGVLLKGLIAVVVRSVEH